MSYFNKEGKTHALVTMYGIESIYIVYYCVNSILGCPYITSLCHSSIRNSQFMDYDKKSQYCLGSIFPSQSLANHH